MGIGGTEQTGYDEGFRILQIDGRAAGRLRLDDLWLSDEELSTLVQRHQNAKQVTSGADAIAGCERKSRIGRGAPLVDCQRVAVEL